MESAGPGSASSVWVVSASFRGAAVCAWSTEGVGGRGWVGGGVFGEVHSPGLCLLMCRIAVEAVEERDRGDRGGEVSVCASMVWV